MKNTRYPNSRTYGETYNLLLLFFVKGKLTFMATPESHFALTWINVTWPALCQKKKKKKGSTICHRICCCLSLFLPPSLQTGNSTDNILFSHCIPEVHSVSATSIYDWPLWTVNHAFYQVYIQLIWLEFFWFLVIEGWHESLDALVMVLGTK